MKGMVFTAFLEMVEDKFSADMVDDIIDDANLPSGGAYTAVGTYDHKELVSMVVALSKRTNIPATDLVAIFGENMFSLFYIGYPNFFAGVPTAFDFLMSVDQVIHVEVLKLYPEANLPKFDCELNGNTLTMTYRSPRCFSDLALGLIKGCGQHFGENLHIEREDLSAESTKFIITKIH
jgi:hypothetical protein